MQPNADRNRPVNLMLVHRGEVAIDAEGAGAACCSSAMLEWAAANARRKDRVPTGKQGAGMRRFLAKGIADGHGATLVAGPVTALAVAK